MEAVRSSSILSMSLTRIGLRVSPTSSSTHSSTIKYDQMMAHLITNDIISPTQYAFRPNSSTTLALQTILNKIHKHKSQRHPLLAIYVDLSKAYDTISHAKLLHKLRHDFNFTEDTTTFFSTYFQNRQQTTHTQNAQSRMQTIRNPARQHTLNHLLPPIH